MPAVDLPPPYRSADPARTRAALLLIKGVHTIVWVFFVACIAAIYLFASRGRFAWALAAAGIVLVEVGVLVANRLRCPLTPIAARHTEDRRPNFDIFLPEWVAEHNKEIFGSLYVGGILYLLVLWLRSPGTLVQAVHPLVIHLEAFATHQHMQATVAVSGPLHRQLEQQTLQFRQFEPYGIGSWTR